MYRRDLVEDFRGASYAENGRISTIFDETAHCFAHQMNRKRVTPAPDPAPEDHRCPATDSEEYQRSIADARAWVEASDAPPEVKARLLEGLDVAAIHDGAVDALLERERLLAHARHAYRSNPPGKRDRAVVDALGLSRDRQPEKRGPSHDSDHVIAFYRALTEEREERQGNVTQVADLDGLLAHAVPDERGDLIVPAEEKRDPNTPAPRDLRLPEDCQLPLEPDAAEKLVTEHFGIKAPRVFLQRAARRRGIKLRLTTGRNL